jgi:FKBP-type peptidyl-prolyl cis-trans isomerase FkpA
MRVFWILLPLALMAQTPSKPAAAASAKPAAVKPAAATAKPAARKPVPAKARPAAAKPEAPAAPALATDEQKTIYAIGLFEYERLNSLGLSPEEMVLVERAMKDAKAGTPAVKLEEWAPKINAFAQQRVIAKQKAAAKGYLDKAAAEPGAVVAQSGLIYKELTAGAGASPKATDTVKVHYRGTLVNGTEFDSSYKRNEPASFQLNQVIPCWTEGVQKMKAGGKAQLTCPSDIAYGPAGRPPTIPGGSTLIFEIELLDVTAPPPPAAAPAPAKK